MIKNNFVILSEPRSGSGHLARFLYSLDDIYFKNIESGKNMKIKYKIYEFLNESLKIKNKDKYIRDYYGLNNKIIGSKVLLRNGQFYYGLLDLIKELEIKPIILDRNDYLNQIISYSYADTIKCYHNFKNEKNYEKIGQKIKIDLNNLNEYINNFIECVQNKKKSINYFNDNNIDYLHVKYDEVINKFGKEKILNFIGLEYKDEYDLIEKEKKMNIIYSDVISNYDEVVGIINNKLKIHTTK